MNQEELNTLAFSLGYTANKLGKKRIPATDIEFCKMLKLTKNTIQLLNCRIAGYERFTDEEVAKIFPEDPYFQLTQN